MPRFVILEHDFPFLHWDLMLECEIGLRTWRLLEKPVENSPGQNSLIQSRAESLPDHRPAYLDYEGPVSQNRGTVTQWESGLYLLLSQSETNWEFRLEGNQLIGFASISKLECSNRDDSEEEKSSDNHWEFRLLSESVN